ncbi:MAG: hypothetical protein ACLFQP_00635 [Halothece sp.]
MSKNNQIPKIPIWLSAKAKFVAEKLVEDGFWFCGTSEDFILLEEDMESAGDWLVGGGYQEIMIDAICDKALFVKDVDLENIEAEFNRVKQLIVQAENDFDNDALSGQLSLFN